LDFQHFSLIGKGGKPGFDLFCFLFSAISQVEFLAPPKRAQARAAVLAHIFRWGERRYQEGLGLFHPCILAGGKGRTIQAMEDVTARDDRGSEAGSA